MPSIVGPVRYMKARKGDTPLERTGAGYGGVAPVVRDDPVSGRRVVALAPPDFGPPVDPRTLSARQQANREAVYAWVMGGRAERDFVAFLAARACPMDDWVIVAELVRAWVECLILAMAADPKARKIPCLPGCGAMGPDGMECRNPRCVGHLYCPEHEELADEGEQIWAPRTEADARAAGLTVQRR